MNAPSEDIKDMLEDHSALGLTFASNLFIGRTPKEPDDAVTIFDYEGYSPDPTLEKDTMIYYSSLQIQVRSNGYVTGMTLARNIMDYLHSRAQEEWNGTLYTAIRAMGEPVPLSWDDNGRIIFTINFNLMRR